VSLPAAVTPRTGVLRQGSAFHYLLTATLLLLAFGLIMVLSSSSVTAYATYGTATALFTRQLLFAGAGVVLMALAAVSPPPLVARLGPILLVSAIGLLLLVMVPGVGVTVGGQRNWIDVGLPVNLQPSEFAKLALAVWGAGLLARREHELDQWRRLLVPLLPVSGLVIVLVLAGNDLGTALVMVPILLGLLLAAGAPWRVFLAIGAGGAAVAVLVSLGQGYRVDRLRTWLDPSSDPLGAGWQVTHSTFALASGGWTGLGIGASREKWGGLPQAHTDFIFAIVGEELGILGTLGVLVVIAVITTTMLGLAARTTSAYTRLLTSAVCAWVLVQALVNIGAVLGLVPVTGVPLPLVSYGGSSLITTLIALGLVMGCARQEPERAPPPPTRNPPLAAPTAAGTGHLRGRR